MSTQAKTVGDFAINPELKPGDRYYGIAAPKMFWDDLKNDPEKVKKVCNGVGSQVGWLGKLTYHFIPNTIWFLNITEASDVHDYMYSYPDVFDNRANALEWKHKADQLLLENILTLIKRDSWTMAMRIIRERRAISYYTAVSEVGEESFLAGKTINGIVYKNMSEYDPNDILNN